MRDRQVDAVDVVLDRSNQMASGITDFFLRKALLRNKNKTGIESIIQTIQEKQDNIRMLPKSQSFIVQGCAGSGKTMVLLHRLRYLLFNNDIDSEEYLVLIPTTNFGTFIKDACAQFRIQANNVIPVQSYYKKLSGEKQIDESADASELVFSPEYLKRVYSREFVQDACRDLLSMFESQMDTLTACCDAALSALIDQTTTELNEKISQSKQVALSRAASIAELLIPYVQTKLNAYEDIPSLIAEIDEDRDMADREYQRIQNENPLLFLSAEEIIAADATLQQMQSEIKSTEEKVARASIFTVNAQKRKLEKLKQNYEERYREITQRAEAAEKKRIEEQAEKAQYVYDSISIEDAGNILSRLSRIYDETEQTITDAKNAVENIQDTLEKRYSKEISLLVKVIESPVSIAEACADSINALESIMGVLSQYMQLGSELYDLFLPLCPTRERKQMENQCKLYKSRMERDRANYLNLLLFNACKRRIRNEFDVKISSAYKHYWYLQTYCAYLTKGIRETPRRYLYIDEAQDLSIDSYEMPEEMIRTKTVSRNNLRDEIRQAQSRMKEISEQKKAITTYRRTKAVYQQYRETRWSSSFYQEHAKEIDAHQWAQEVYRKAGGKLPTLSALSAEYDQLLSQKREDSTRFQSLKREVSDLYHIKTNLDIITEDERPAQVRERTEERKTR